MAEYIGSAITPTRRRTIIREAQFPKTAQVVQYRSAREGLVKYLGDGARRPALLATAIAGMKARAEGSESDWVRNDCRNSIDAIGAFERSYNKSSLRKLDCREVTSRGHHIDTWPTRIGVAFDLTIHKPSDEGPDTFGAAIFVFARGESSAATRKERCSNIAGLIYMFCAKYLDGGSFGAVDPSLCVAIDVFAGLEHKCPGTFARKGRHVEDSCAEIATIWPTIDPPGDYDGPPLRRAP